MQKQRDGYKKKRDARATESLNKSKWCQHLQINALIEHHQASNLKSLGI